MEGMREITPEIKEYLRIPIVKTCLSTRVINNLTCCHSFTYMFQVYIEEDKELLKFRNFGRKSLQEVKDWFEMKLKSFPKTE